MRFLTPEEAEAFRDEYREKDREVQRYINVYLGGLAVIAGWIVGPQSQPLILMGTGNGGNNVYVLLALVVFNALFLCFMIFKGIVIHETMQFVTLLSPSESAWPYWEQWRRSRYGLTKAKMKALPVRDLHLGILGLLPLCVSVALLWLIWDLLHTPTTAVVAHVGRIYESAKTASSTYGLADLPDAAQLRRVQAAAMTWFWLAVASHALPLWFLAVHWGFGSYTWRSIASAVGTRGNAFEPPAQGGRWLGRVRALGAWLWRVLTWPWRRRAERDERWLRELRGALTQPEGERYRVRVEQPAPGIVPVPIIRESVRRIAPSEE
jgi:hypothetical protein